MTASHQAPAGLANALAWAEEAACRGYDLDWFFTESKAGVARAKRVCADCPVREECLAEALRAEDGSRYGISGGLDPDERAKLVASTVQAKGAAPARPRTGRKPAECGTRSAYQRHVKNGEPIDPKCRAANTAADRRLRTTGSTRART